MYPHSQAYDRFAQKMYGGKSSDQGLGKAEVSASLSHGMALGRHATSLGPTIVICNIKILNYIIP